MNNIPTHLPLPKAVKHHLISLRLSINKIKQEYNNLIRRYEDDIKNLQVAISEYQGESITPSQKVTKNKLNNQLRRILYLQKTTAYEDIPDSLFAQVIGMFPVKYVHYEKEEYEWHGNYDKRGRAVGYNTTGWVLTITIVNVDVKAIAWIEQQDELSRVILTREERALVVSMKEAMVIHDESTTFEGYIEDWAHRILHEMNIPYISAVDYRKQYHKQMSGHDREMHKKEKDEQDKVVEQVMRAMEHDDEIKKKVEEILDGK